MRTLKTSFTLNGQNCCAAETEWDRRGLGDAKLLLHRTMVKIQVVLREEFFLADDGTFCGVNGGRYFEQIGHLESRRSSVWMVVDWSEGQQKTLQVTLEFVSMECWS